MDCETPYGKEHYQRYKALEVPPFSMHWWANRYFRRLVRKYVPRGRLLEIGCGTGFFLAEMSRFFHVCGIDISPVALERSRANCPGADIRRMSAEELDIFPEGYFDVVVARHVMEHLRDPAGVLVSCGRILRPGGLLLLVVPHTDSISRKWKRDGWYGYRDPTHISLLSSGEWLGLLRRAGFEVRKAFADGLWDVPYVPLLPAWLQKCLFGSLGGIQALLGLTVVPVPLGEALVVVAERKEENPGGARLPAGREEGRCVGQA